MPDEDDDDVLLLWLTDERRLTLFPAAEISLNLTIANL